MTVDSVLKQNEIHIAFERKLWKVNGYCYDCGRKMTDVVTPETLNKEINYVCLHCTAHTLVK